MDAVPNTFPDLLIAYNAVWFLLGVYIVSLGLRLSKLESKFQDKDKS